MSVAILKALNKLFPKVTHPFNLQAEGKQTYAQWQFEGGAKTVACFEPDFGPADIFAGKTVLDMGCGASGKSLYYISIGAEKVVGVDVVEHYKAEAEAFARELGYEDRFQFILGDALHLPIEDNVFDVVIMNDFMEHIYDPEGAIREALRVLKPGGRIFVNFPPYYHPTGAHLSDVIGIPWVHMFFREKTLIAAYKDLVHGMPDEQERLALRFGVDANGKETISYINKMTIRRFKHMVKKLGLNVVWYREIPLRTYFTLFAKTPVLKEMFVKMCACVIEKPVQ
jgi:ubiquinone/menaquinone biosynthesis C-methylase UbiE